MAHAGAVIERADLQEQAAADWSWLATGAAGLGFVAFVVFQNVALLADEPFGDASISEISEFYATSKTQVGIAIALVAVNIPLIILFASGYARAVRERLGGEPIWTRAGYGGIIATSLFFGITTVFRGALAVNGETLAENPALTQMIWDLHGTTFALTSAPLGLTLAMFAVSGRLSWLTPVWLAYPAIAGGGLLTASAAVTVPTVEGSSIGIIGLIGFVIWLFWLAFTSVGLIRSRGAAA